MDFTMPKEEKAEAKFGTSHSLFNLVLSSLKGTAPVPLVRTPVKHEFPQAPINVDSLLSDINVDSLLSEMSFFVKTASNTTETLPQLKML